MRRAWRMRRMDQKTRSWLFCYKSSTDRLASLTDFMKAPIPQYPKTFAFGVIPKIAAIPKIATIPKIAVSVIHAAHAPRAAHISPSLQKD